MGKICINKDLCSKCKGSCCKVSGCMYMPSDFKKMKYITIKYIENLSINNRAEV